MKSDHLQALLHPTSIAVIGASNNSEKIGYAVVHNLIESGYQGDVYPINPKSEEIQGLKAYPNVTDVPEDVDAAIIVVPAKYVLDITEDCGKKGVKVLLVITSGFSEVGKEELEKQIVDTAKSYGVRLLGPNIVGVLSNKENMNASFAGFLPLPGQASLISQSGALLVAMDAATYTRGIGFNEMISIGNMSDIQFSDLIKFMGDDEATKCISLYIETINEGRRFIDTCRQIDTPILALKAGSSKRGAAAAASHTGSLVGATKVYQAAFKQAGVIQASDVNNFFDRTLALTLQPSMRGDNLAILTNGGGVGVLASDAAERFGIPATEIPQDLQEGLMDYMPDYGAAKNPVDLTGMANTERFHQTTKLAFSHPWVNGLVVIICETQLLDLVEIVKGVHRAVKETGIKDKPIIVSLVGGDSALEAGRWLIEHGIPAYNSPDLAVNALAALRDHGRYGSPGPVLTSSENRNDSQTAREAIAQARERGRTGLTEIESRKIFAAYDLPVVDTRLARSEEEALDAAQDVGYPVVLKIVSHDILHKSDAGGVKVGIQNAQELSAAYQSLLKNAKQYKAEAVIEGVAVQEMAAEGTEVIIGSVNDPTFGPTVMFGLGGIFVEVLEDTTFRVAPVSTSEAASMLGEIRAAAILEGARGKGPLDCEALAETLSRYSEMAADLGDDIAETDANPCLVYEQGKGVKIVDARVILKEV